MGLLNSHLAASVSLYKQCIHTQLRNQTSMLFTALLLSNCVIFVVLVIFPFKFHCFLQVALGDLIEEKLVKGILRVG